MAVVSRLGAARGHGVALLAVLIGFGATLLMLGLAPTFTTVALILLAVNALGATTTFSPRR